MIEGRAAPVGHANQIHNPSSPARGDTEKGRPHQWSRAVGAPACKCRAAPRPTARSRRLAGSAAPCTTVPQLGRGERCCGFIGRCYAYAETQCSTARWGSGWRRGSVPCFQQVTKSSVPIKPQAATHWSQAISQPQPSSQQQVQEVHNGLFPRLRQRKRILNQPRHVCARQCHVSAATSWGGGPAGRCGWDVVLC